MTSEKSTLPVADTRRTRRELLRRLGAHRGRLTAALLTLLSRTAATLATPPVLGGIVNAVVDEAEPGRVTVLGIVLVLVAATGAALAFAGGRMLVSLVQDVLAGLREDVFETAIHLPGGVVESSGSSDVVSRVTRDVEAISEAASDVLPDVTAAGFTIALSVVGLAVLDPRLALARAVLRPVAPGPAQHQDDLGARRQRSRPQPPGRARERRDPARHGPDGRIRVGRGPDQRPTATDPRLPGVELPVPARAQAQPR
ncbi:ABC transporter transmembrane domain-containing protein [Streptomyces sp. NPDC058239]|uniref:ABC transporter transmembrane domain-containing protein n=1 Tax=unclassified Streptomyces TaxID=2593676 RepID=UPI00365B349E